MSTSTNYTGRQVSFTGLFKEFQRVQIPIIQRDYAQGRASEEELRQAFLSALKGALERTGRSGVTPLDLDFIYGSAFPHEEGAEDDAFAPLDGQQRLTTLFLLHWYLAWTSGETSDFQERFTRDRKSRLAY